MGRVGGPVEEAPEGGDDQYAGNLASGRWTPGRNIPISVFIALLKTNRASFRIPAPLFGSQEAGRLYGRLGAASVGRHRLPSFGRNQDAVSQSADAVLVA